ncbi:MAG: hypothetical protein ABFQ53_03375 [Patescibacteria group bacterium]
MELTNKEKEEKKKKIRGIDLTFIFLSTAMGALFFLCITRSINGTAFLNPWISGMICAAIFEAVLSLFAITVGKKKAIAPIVIIAFLPSIIFTPILWHALVVVVAMLIVIRGLYVMRATLFNALKIKTGIIVRSGMMYIGFALVITVTSQYYFFVQQNNQMMFNADRYVNASNILVDKILESGNVENVAIKTMTVGEFVTFMMEKNKEAGTMHGPEAPSQNDEMLLRWANQAGVDIKKIEEEAEENTSDQVLANISEMTGREVGSQELVSDVFSEIISSSVNKNIQKNAYLRENKENIFTVIFFLIIFSLSPIVRFFAVFFAQFVFMLLRELRIVRVTRTPRDAEVVAF